MFKFCYASCLESEEQMLDDLERSLAQAGVDKSHYRGFMMAISEAFNNAMVHGNGLDQSRQVTFRLEVNELAITADIVDEGSDGLKKLQGRRKRGLTAEGGRGIDLIAHYTDSVDYSQVDSGGLRVTLMIRRKNNDLYTQTQAEEAMETTVREKGSVMILQLSGRLDLASGSALKEQIKKHLGHGTPVIHLNLARVEFINSSGLGALVSIMKEVRLQKGRLTLSNLATYVQEIFDITQLSHIFEIFPTEEEALSSMQGVAIR